MEKKNNSGMLVGILIGLVIALLIGVCLFATGTIGFKTTTTDNGQGSENNKSIKIDESKDYVYDAEYKYDNKYTEFDRTNCFYAVNESGPFEIEEIDYWMKIPELP